ncbi:MAG: acyl-CoA carboxylase subunit epsilon [Humibacillus sp.]
MVGTEDQASAASATPSAASAEPSAASAEPSAAVPALVVRGDPSSEELAALVAVLSLVGGATTSPAAPARSAWADPARVLGGAVAPPGGWRASALPR